MQNFSPPQPLEKTRREQRRSRRHAVALRIDLTQGGTTTALTSIDVSRHGLFVQTNAPPRERFIVQLVIHLPSGALPATAFVSRSVRSGTANGVGFQLFALSNHAKAAWDRFIDGLEEPSPTPLPRSAPAQEVASKEAPPATPEYPGAIFLVRLRDVARLLEFYEQHVTPGHLYLATPVIKEAGADLTLLIIHPVSREEYPLQGVVERVHRVAPKGMEVRLATSTAEDREKFHQFALTGRASPPPPQKVDRPPQESISLDIAVDENALEASEEFEWKEIHTEDLVIDFNLAEETADATPVERQPSLRAKVPNEQRIVRSEADATTDLGDVLGAASVAAVQVLTTRTRDKDVLEIELSCNSCTSATTRLALRPIEGVLGKIAAPRAEWCKGCAAFVAVPRLRPPQERARAMASLGKDANSPSVSMRALFEAVALEDTAKCGECYARIEPNNSTKVLNDALSSMKPGEQRKLKRLKCGQCQKGVLSVKRT